MKALPALLFTLVLFAAACGGSDNGGLLSDKQTQQGQTASQLPQGQPGNLPQQGQPGAVPQVQTGSTSGACALLTKQDAAAALGAPVKDGESVTIPMQNMGAFSVEISSCDYRAVSGTGQVSMQYWKAPQAGQVGLIASSICTGAEKINGVGDSACWLDKDHKELQVFKGATFIGLTVRGGSATSEDAIKVLAKKVADRVK